MKKIILPILAVILLAGCNNNSNQPDAYGNFETDATTISAQTPGEILALNANESDAITKGEILAVIDTTNMVLQMKQLEAQKASIESQRQTVSSQVAINEQQIKNLQINQKRIVNMAATGAATQKQLDDINSQLAIAQEQKNATKSQLSNIAKQADVTDAQMNLLKDQLDKAKITSPINGTVLERYVELGELAAAGKPLFQIADLSTLTLRVYISETQLSQIKLGQKVTVSVDNGNNLKNYNGTISWISSQAEFTPKTIQTKEERVKLVYAIKIRVPNDGSLKIGMPGEATFSGKQ